MAEKKRYLKYNSIKKSLSSLGGILIALTVMMLVLSFMTPHFLTMTNMTNLLRQITTNALLAFGMTFCLICGEIDLSVGSTLALSGVTVIVLLTQNIPLIIAFPFTLLIGMLIGLINGGLVAYTGMPAFIVTLAMQSVIRGMAYIISGNGRVKTTDDSLFRFGNGSVGPIPVPTILVVILAICLGILLARTIFGKHVYATGGNRSAAVYSGINVNRVRILVFMLTGFLAALAGIIIAARINSGQASAGEGTEGDAIAAAVLGGVSFTGGRGTIVGTIIGVLVIGILNNGLNLLEVSYYWQLVCKGIIIMLAVYMDTVRRSKIQ